MRSDHEIKRDVEEELQWNPAIDAADIAVAVKSGVVTLTGFVRSYNEKLEAEAASKGVTGVHAVANDIEVRLPSITERPDPEIARDAVAAIKGATAERLGEHKSRRKGGLGHARRSGRVGLPTQHCGQRSASFAGR